MKLRFIFYFFLLSIIPVLIFAQNNINKDKKDAPKDTAKQEKSASPKSKERTVLITVEKVTEGMTAPTMMITGTAYFSETSEVAAEAAGKVLKVFVSEGDAVEIGQPLASLDDSLLDYSLEAARAGSRQALSNLEKARRDFNRNKILYEQRAIAQQKYQDSLTEYNNAGSAYAAAAATEKKLKSEKDKMVIKSPLKGVIISKDVNVGEWVNSGGVIAEVAALTYEAKVYIPEEVLPYVRAGQTIKVKTNRKEYDGKVLSINSKGDPATRLFLTRIDLGQDPDLKEGILATALIPSGSKVNSLFVSRDAVVERNSVKGVFKISEDERAKFIPVKIIGYNGSYLAISSITEGSLKNGDQVILDGNNAVNNGVKVKITSKFG